MTKWLKNTAVDVARLCELRCIEIEWQGKESSANQVSCPIRKYGSTSLLGMEQVKNGQKTIEKLSVRSDINIMRASTQFICVR